MLVALIAQKVEVKYDIKQITPDEIAARITNLGYDAAVLESDALGQGTIELLVIITKLKFYLVSHHRHVTSCEGKNSLGTKFFFFFFFFFFNKKKKNFKKFPFFFFFFKKF